MFIFSIYLFLLPCIASAGEDYCSDLALDRTVKQTSNHKNHDEQEDACGNFCTCSCCVHIVSVNFQSPEICMDKPIIENAKLSLHYNITLPSNYFGNIWQPPKMG